jgi:hypothetical protein
MAHDISMERADFLEALKPLKSLVKAKELAEAVLSMEGENLTIALVGVATYVRARGAWPGEVRVPGLFMVKLAKMPPPGDPIRFQVRDERLHIGSLFVACVVQDSWKSEIELSLDPSLTDLLRLHYEYPADRIERAGLTKRVEEAKGRASKMIRKAASALAPLEIKDTDLVELLRQRLKKDIETE